jgi:hypothetical protein
MRGDYYLWRDEDRLHLWAGDGYDGWDESGWAEGREVTVAQGDAAPSGLGLRQEVVDEYVAMRLAEMVRERLLAGAVERALDKHGGNFGCSALRELRPVILAAFSASDPHER